MRSPARTSIPILLTALTLTIPAATAWAQVLVEPPPIEPAGRSTLRSFWTPRTNLFATTPLVPAPETADDSSIDAPRPSGKLFASLYAGLVTTQALDVHSTLSAIDAGCVEANAMMRWATSSTGRFVAVKAATTAGIVLILERLRRHHPKSALFLLVAINSAAAVIVAHNYRMAERPQ